MQRCAWMLCLALVWAYCMALAGEEAADKQEDPVAAKAEELTADKTSQAEKILALHAFVRDEIREVPTEYG